LKIKRRKEENIKYIKWKNENPALHPPYPTTSPPSFFGNRKYRKK